MNESLSAPSEARYFTPGATLNAAMEIYQHIAKLPLVCPHGHVDPNLFCGANSFGNPVELLIKPDHYIFRMLYSQRIPLEALGISPISNTTEHPVETDPRIIWQLFIDNFHLFRGTPSGMWLKDELSFVLGIEQPLTSENAQAIYDQIDEKLKFPEFQPQQAFDRFNIETLCTTDAATDDLSAHKAIREGAWHRRILPTFRPDALINLSTPDWQNNLKMLEQATNSSIGTYAAFIQALEMRRQFFKQNGAVSTDHAILHLDTTSLTENEVESIFQRALSNTLSYQDISAFSAHMLTEMARMSVEDGLVMQIHPGSYRNHNAQLFDKFGVDKGCDIPVRGEFTQALRPLLSKYGNNPNLSIILFTLDETNYSRELAPLAGHYPALKLGPPWWFNDSWNGMRRYFDQVMETAGIYNTCGFNDDTRAFLSIPARHDLWRRAAAEWLAGLQIRQIINRQEAFDMAWQLVYGLTKKAYRL